MDISISNLSKSYGRKQALRDVSLTIPSGMYGLLGRNGAGKTTLMRILATLQAPDSGSVTMDGVPLKHTRQIREMVGYLPQDFGLYPGMTVFDAMDYLGLLSGIPTHERRKRIGALLERVNLQDNTKTRVRSLSGGMCRRLGIAQALLHDPQILIVDEPTAGLDPEERIRFRNLLCEFAEGRIVLLSTHIVEDIETTCQNLAVLHESRVLFSGSAGDLTRLADGKVYTLEVPQNQQSDIKNRYSLLSMQAIPGGKVKCRVLSEHEPSEKAVQEEPTLEDGYMQLIKSREV